ncbi:MAG TPA: acetyl-CoA carboxylase biotin carboxyl carrier protein [Anaeromyxobacteraceae bacterium]|nr:acetyl-CoA carboxylase biotin carboxyl carrier protein [Anaeromyxobacteraceae bacterium]
MARRLEQAKRSDESPIRAEPGGAFSLDEVKALVKVLEGTDVTSLRWDRNGQKIVIRRGAVAAPTMGVVQVAAPGPVPLPVAAAPAPAPAAAVAPAPKPEAKPGVLVTSPFVGTFYRAPSPDSPAFVDVGSSVKKGQVLCIVEAMKLMNEIEAEASGKIAEILVANATPVEFGQPLFRIEPG